jgi:hypothetical protein
MNPFNSSTFQLFNLIAAVHFENLLFLLFIGIAFFFQVLTRAATKSNKRPGDTQRRSSSTTPPVPRQQPETDEDRVRKFLEALGQPTTSTPPPPVRPRTNIPPRPVAPIQPPRAAWPEISRKVPASEPSSPTPAKRIQLPGQITEPQYEQKTFRRQMPSPVFEVHQTTAAPEPPLPPTTTPATAYAIATEPEVVRRKDQIDLVNLLRSPEGLRNAIILREVFGPPRSLQPL